MAFRDIYNSFYGDKTKFKEEIDMKNLIKGIVNYTVFVGVPILCISGIAVGVYRVGHDDGVRDGLSTATAIVKSYKKAGEENEE